MTQQKEPYWLQQNNREREFESYRVFTSDPGAATERLTEAIRDLTLVLSEVVEAIRGIKRLDISS